MSLLKKWNSIDLILRIICGLVVGTLLGALVPQATVIGIFGDLFVGALKSLAPLLVFFIVLDSLTERTEGAGKHMGVVIALYLISTLAASLVAVVASFVSPSALVLASAGDSAVAPSGIAEVMKTLLTNAVSNPVASLAGGNYIGILFWAIILGVALRNAKSETKKVFADVTAALSLAIKWVINCAPFGIMGIIFTVVSTTGFSAFASYIHLIVVLLVCMFFSALVINPLMVFVCLHKNPYPLVLRCLKESGLMAFFTRSSAANIPVNMKLCADLGLSEDRYSVSIPLGATINMAGAAITIAVMTMASVHTIGIEVDYATAFLLCVLAALGACGASGVAGGSLLLIPMACGLFGISNEIAMQVVGVGFIIGVIQDSCETALNSSADVLFTATAEFYSRRKNGEKIEF